LHSISEGPPPARASAKTARATRYTASTSLPSTMMDGRPYDAARSAAGCSTGVTLPIGVYSMYRLFSQTKTAGSFQTAAMLMASWKAPMLVVPSPKKATATWRVPRYWADQAAPMAMGMCAPTMA
jgi:hypothetical protein